MIRLTKSRNNANAKAFNLHPQETIKSRSKSGDMKLTAKR
jgi:hypothetical protein